MVPVDTITKKTINMTAAKAPNSTANLGRLPVGELPGELLSGGEELLVKTENMWAWNTVTGVAQYI